MSIITIENTTYNEVTPQNISILKILFGNDIKIYIEPNPETSIKEETPDFKDELHELNNVLDQRTYKNTEILYKEFQDFVKNKLEENSPSTKLKENLEVLFKTSPNQLKQNDVLLDELHNLKQEALKEQNAKKEECWREYMATCEQIDKNLQELNSSRTNWPKINWEVLVKKNNKA